MGRASLARDVEWTLGAFTPAGQPRQALACTYDDSPDPEWHS